MANEASLGPYNGFNLPGKDEGMVDNHCIKDLRQQNRRISVS